MNGTAITEEKVRELIKDIESEHIERTIATKDTDKFSEAICAFSNDLPNTARNGYLLIGVRDDGTLSGLRSDDKILQTLGGLRSDGNILPQPILSISVYNFVEGDVIAIEVRPSPFPPVRYKGRIWIRVGPRKAIANEMEERILIEKRTANVSTFDVRPSIENKLDSIDQKVFIDRYLPRAIDPDTLAEDQRDILERLASLRFYSSNYGFVTNAGLLIFGKEVERTIPGAYIQFVRFNGLSEADDPVNEKKFSGNLFSILPELDKFLEYAIIQQKPVPVSTLKEELRFNYPKWAIRELLMNAIMHRDYESNAPIKFYQYNDRVEIINPGGLYGNARPENFPNVNDYRNPVIAEAMKVLGYVNRFNRGIARVNKELNNNGNPEALFNYKNIGVFGVKVINALFNREMIEVSREKTREKTREKIISLIKDNTKITIAELAKEIGITKKGIEYQLNRLKTEGMIERIGGDKGGYWKIIH